MKVWLVRLAAIVIFAVSFALPAVRIGPPGDGGISQPGYKCAVYASVFAFSGLAHLHWSELSRDSILLPMSGLVNYLFLVIFVLSFWPRLVRTRLIVGALVLACFAATWDFFAANQLAPLAGHYLWVAGALLLVAPDVAMALRRRPPASPNPGEISPPVSTRGASGA